MDMQRAWPIAMSAFYNRGFTATLPWQLDYFFTGLVDISMNRLQ